MKLAFFEMENWQADYLKDKFDSTYDVSFSKEQLDEKNASQYKDYDAIGIFIYSNINKKILDTLPKLKLIVTMSTGYDHIDLGQCAKKNIKVCNVPFYGENTVAEHTFALILALSRKIFQSIERTRKGSFELEGLRGFDLKGKTLGLIGTGHIAAHVARIAYGFEMNILGYDVMQNNEIVNNYKLKYVKLEDLLKDSDIISLHLPLNNKTKHIINSKNLKLMKASALLVNTARGALIDTKDLVKALQEKKIGGVALDVLEEEKSIKEESQLLSSNFINQVNLKTLIADHVLLKYDNVIITPHNAFNSQEALIRIIDTSVENIKAFVSGVPQNVVEYKKK